MLKQNLETFATKFLAFVLMFCGVLILSILLTHNPLNVSFNSTTFSGNVLSIYTFRNYIADLLIQIFGIAIFSVPTILIIYSYLIFNKIAITNIFIKIMLLLLFLLICPINIYILSKYNAGLIGYFLYSYLPMANYLPIVLVPLSILLLFIAFSIPITKYITLISYIFYIYNWLVKKINSNVIKDTSTKPIKENNVVITPDLSYLENSISKDDQTINFNEYKLQNKKILQNSLFLQPLNNVNKQNLLDNNNAENNLHTITKTVDANIDNISIDRPETIELHKNNFKIVKEIFKNYSIPLSFLSLKPDTSIEISKAEIAKSAANLEKVMQEFGILGKIVNIIVGPIVTMYEITIPAGMKTTKLTSLETDIALRMSAVSVRIAVVPGRDVIGIELPNPTRKTIYLKEILQSTAFVKTLQLLPITLGLDTAGKPIIEDLSTMPHCLIAGTTGSGKSVGINTIILSLLYKFSPEKCKLIMIDPKMLELSVYQDIPHLITPVVTDPKKAIAALKWAVTEMDNRYNLMSIIGVRNIVGYNEKIKDTNFINQKINTLNQENTPEIEFNFMPYIAIIIDEMADLMLVAGKEVEIAVQRLAQKARAAGIHLIMATQRPSTDVITGTIKANFPTRISFKVSSSIDSRTILNASGAEQLLGKGDMLYLSGLGIKRVHSPFVADDEVIRVAEYLKKLGKPKYVENITSTPISSNDYSTEDNDDENLLQQAIEVIQLTGKVSISHLQNKLRIGFNKSTRLVDLLEAKGIVGPDKGAGKRDIFIK